MLNYARDSLVLSTRTVANWYSYCRETIGVFMIENANVVQNQIGGPGQIVQIDRSKFSKRNIVGKAY